MTKPITDYEARKQALSSDKSFIIQAPAGSGKTGLLIQRYLRLLSLVEVPEEIIAITFTRKAATEMQSRILNALNMAAMKQTETECEHDKTTYELAKVALKRDQQKGWHVIKNPGRLRLQTIDSLCAYLTRQMPMLACLGTQPETLDDAKHLYQQAAINTLAELESGADWSESIANLIFHLDNDLPRIKNLIVNMLKKRDQWLRYVVKDYDRKDMEKSLVRLIEDQLSITTALFPKEFKTELLDLMQSAAKNLAESGQENRIISCLPITSMPDNKASSLELWRGITELLLTSKGTWRKNFTIKDGFPPASDNKFEDDERASKKKRVQFLLTELQRVDGLQDSLATINSLPSASYTDAEWIIVNALCELLKLAAGQLHMIFAERNQMDFTGIADSAVNALGTVDSPTALALQLDYHIKHLLVDEYQDISANQYRLLQGLTREWSMDDGRSLFLVGDPMQSIYRFREAEVSLFIKTFDDASLGNIPLEKLRLSVNFRSQKGLVNWVNDNFADIFPRKDDQITGGVSYSSADAYSKTMSSNNVRVYPLYGSVYQKESQHVVKIIQKIKQTSPDDNIAVLVRSRSHLNKIIPALRAEQISFKAIDIEALASQSSIQDLLALTRAFLFQADRVAWLACLRAPWCGLSLESLYILCDHNREKTVWECLCDTELVNQLPYEQKSRLQVFKKTYLIIQQLKQRLSIRDAIESFWIQLGGPATLTNKTDLENSSTYFSLIERLDQGGSIIDLQELVDHVSQLYAGVDLKADNQIQVMTIHKSKGLEFDHVILPGLGRTPRSSQGDLLVWLLRQRNHGQEDLILAPIRAGGQNQAPIYNYINNTDKTKQRHEDARLLYVAITRAKKTCHLIGHTSLKETKGELSCKPPSSGSLLSYLWPTVKALYEKNMPATSDKSEEELILMVNQETTRLCKDWQHPELPPSLIGQQVIEGKTESEPVLVEFEWAGETIKHIGSIVHRAIQCIAEQGIVKWTTERINAEQQGFDNALKQLSVPRHERMDAVECIVKALTNMVTDERGQWILSIKHKHQKNEHPISGIVNDKMTNAVLDRTFIDAEGNRWIIDYKISRHDGENSDAFLDHEQERYKKQLEKYGSLMKQLGEKNIKLGLYFPLLQGWREWK
jgi:ATP-dependent helicase/nuclease subunit A